MKSIFRAKTLLLFLLLAFMQIVQSCHGGSDDCSGKQVTCPSFQDSMADQWIPYTINQQLIFTSANAKSDTITFRNVDKTQSHQEKISASNNNCVATANWGNSFNTEKGIDTLVNFFVSQSIDQYSNEKQLSVKNQFRTLAIHGYKYSDTGLVMYEAGRTVPTTYLITSFKENVTLGNKLYSKVQSFEFDTTLIQKGYYFPPNTIFKFYIAKNIGLVAYQRYPDNKLWVKQ